MGSCKQTTKCHFEKLYRLLHKSFTGKKDKMSKALQLYKTLHRTTQKVFRGDLVALNATQAKIRQEYEKNRYVESATAIDELIKFGYDVDDVLRKRVLQLEETNEKKYKANIRDDMAFGENTMYRDDISQE